MLTSPTCVIVEFELPDWCADERFNYRKKIYFPFGHIFAGQIDRVDERNRIDDILFKVKGIREISISPFECFCKIQIEYSDNILADIERVRLKIHRALSRFKEAKNG